MAGGRRWAVASVVVAATAAVATAQFQTIAYYYRATLCSTQPDLIVYTPSPSCSEVPCSSLNDMSYEAGCSSEPVPPKDGKYWFTNLHDSDGNCADETPNVYGYLTDVCIPLSVASSIYVTCDDSGYAYTACDSADCTTNCSTLRGDVNVCTQSGNSTSFVYTCEQGKTGARLH